MKNENLTLDNFIKGLRNLGVKSISLELMPNLSMSNNAVPFSKPSASVIGKEVVTSCDTPDPIDQRTVDTPPVKQVKDVAKSAQEIIDKKGGVLVEEKPVASAKQVTLKKLSANTKQETPETKKTKKVDRFERFATLVEHDDGSKENAIERKSIVNKLKLDDLLRINNEFSCGIDTDCKIGELRKTILSLF